MVLNSEQVLASKQLITTLCEHLPDNITGFFNLEQKKYFKEYNSINDLVGETFRELYTDSEIRKTDINAKKKAEIKKRTQRKKRWVDLFNENVLTYPLSNENNPFYNINNAFLTLPGQSFIKLYGTNDIEKVMESLKTDITRWHEDNNSLLAEFPLISSKTINQIVSSYKTDLLISLMKIIVSLWNGNIQSFFNQKPFFLMEHPLFAPQKTSVPLIKTVDSYVADLFSYERDKGEDLVFQAYLNNGEEPRNSLDIFDERDHQILLYTMNDISLSFYQNREFVVDPGAVAKSINPHPNAALYEDIIARYHRMQGVGFKLFKKSDMTKPILSFSFFDTVMNDESSGKLYLRVIAGNAVYDAITKQQVIRVKSADYNSLEQKMSRLLFHHLQKERINLSNTNNPDANGLLHKIYDYSFFQRAMVLKKGTKKAYIKLISESLQEFIDKKIVLAKFDCDPATGSFTLYYFPLSEDEKADFTITMHNTSALTGNVDDVTYN